MILDFQPQNRETQSLLQKPHFVFLCEALKLTKVGPLPTPTTQGLCPQASLHLVGRSVRFWDPSETESDLELFGVFRPWGSEPSPAHACTPLNPLHSRGC